MNVGDRLHATVGVRPDVASVVEHSFTSSTAELVAEYEAAVGDRDPFLWKWLDFLLPEVTFACVGEEHRESVQRKKFVLTMFIVLLDDLAEKRRDRSTFEQARKIPFDDQVVQAEGPHIDTEYLRFAEGVWTRFERELMPAVRFEAFAEALYFDLRQNLTAIDYASLANRHLDLVNLEESIRYGAHNMLLLTYADIDLMHAPSFDRRELAQLRRVVAHAQELMRVGNWIATWEREVAEGDFSSGVLVYALENGFASPDELYRARRPSFDHDRLITTIKERRIEQHFIEKCQGMHSELVDAAEELTSVDLDDYLDGIEQAMEFYLGTRREL